MVAADNRLREMVSLPEKYVYGWLFGIRSESAELEQYKLTCYDLLYDHFHGVITERLTVLRQKTETEVKIEEAEKALKETDEYQNLESLKKQKSLEGKRLTQLDVQVVQQMDIFNSEN